ncbi:MAG TPA: YhbY family RNA-binding protein [Clostridia bacterium]|nr:YhbY family RNA-binding protein [Clostridia bacterium]
MIGKERAYLKKLAHSEKPILQLGKDGLSENFLKELEQTLEMKELVKLDLLPGSGDKKLMVEEILEKTKAEFISQVGRKLVLYRESSTLPREERLNPARKVR